MQSEARDVPSDLARRSREHEAVLAAVQEYLYAFDRDERLVYANPRVLGLWGLTQEQSRGMTIGALSAAVGVSPALLHGVRRVFATGEVVRNESEYTSRDGRRSVYENTLGPVPGPSGTVELVVGTSRDVSEQKRIEAERDFAARQRQLALDAAQLGWWQYDPATRVATWDEGYKRIFGMSGYSRPNDEILARIVHPEDLPGLWARVEAALDPVRSRPFAAEYRINRPDGALRWIEAHGLAVFEGEGESRRAVNFVGTVADITERKQAELDLVEADRRKNEFLAILSHELRNPLAPILNSSYILQHAPPGGEQAARARAVIERQARQLARLVDDLLEITRIANGKIRLQREVLDLNVLVRGCADDHRVRFAEAGVALEVCLAPGPALVEGDPARLAQVIGNLLGNAAKFTGKGGRTQLSVSAPKGQVVLTIRDTGPGIAPELIDRIFEPFVQGDDTLHRSKGGLGLGLAVLKVVVELHGGSVAAHSAGPGTGAEFVVTLPAAPPAPTAGARTRGPGAARPRRVLVIEDHVDAASSLRAVLELHGDSVWTATEGLQGLAMALDLKPDLVLCDIGIPGIDGFEVARRVRTHPDLAGTRLVALTGYALPEDVAKAREAGFDEHLAKPVDPDALRRL